MAVLLHPDDVTEKDEDKEEPSLWLRITAENDFLALDEFKDFLDSLDDEAYTQES